MSGGKGGSQIVGYRYYMGMHLAVCHGPVDALTEIVVGERSAWTGNVTASGRLALAADSLFGGDKSQGGISGPVDVALGESTLAPNDYLVAKIGAPQPAYRGVFSLIGRQLFIGSNNPYAKPWWVRVRRAPKGWYTTAASITMPGGVVAANPAHILVECLTNAAWGMGYSINAMDDAAFRAAADQLTAESFGLNLQWSQQTSIEQFVQMVVDHIGAVLAVRPDTGQFTLTLLRGGYDPTTLPLYNPDNVLELVDYQRASWGETTGEVVVTYTRHDNGKDTSVAVQDLANIQAQGGVVSQTRRYPGITDDALAARVAMRDLATLSVPLARVQIKTNRQAWNLLPGALFRLDWPALGITGLALRVAGIDTGTLLDGAITIDAVEDVFGLPAASYTAPQPTGWANPVQPPAPASPRLLVEAPYYDLVRAMSQADLANLAATDCYLYALAGKPSGAAYNAQLYSKASAQSAYAAQQIGGWVQTVQLAAAVPKAVSSAGVAFTGSIDTTLFTVGGYALIDAEVVQITAVNATAGTFDCNRGMLDTVPATHAVGATVWLADGAQIRDRTPWTVNETVNAKLLTTTGLGTLTLAAAPVDSITFGQRQNRPYAPGNFTLNAAAWPKAILGALTTAWSHRDRVQQADNLILQSAGNIGPETGVSYALTVYGEANTALRTLTGLTGTSDAWALADEITASNLVSPSPARVLIVPTTNDYATIVGADNPLAWWRLDESTGTIWADSQANPIDLTINGAPT
ncbi:phage tail protein, partial [Thiomonas sp.]|uniref:phage tail protein n=1 Tax=Thiomonas sp. TaxID=2047785 RepID=UPI0025899050